MVDYINREQYGDLSDTDRQIFWDAVVASGFVYDDLVITNDDDWRNELTSTGRFLWWDAFSREFNPDDNRPPLGTGGGAVVNERPDGLGEPIIQDNTNEEEIIFEEEEDEQQIPDGLDFDDDGFLGKDNDYLKDLHLEPLKPPACRDKCRLIQNEREKKCKVLRKRVADALKKVGCPSKVTRKTKRGKRS